MEGVDDHSRTPSGGDSDLKRRVELYALEGQLRRSKNNQLTFGQVTNRLVDRWGSPCTGSRARYHCCQS
jgi:hypothetical protein